MEDRNLLSVLLWDPQQSGGSNLGGPGNWTNGAATVWYDADLNADVAWTNGDTAVFQGTADTVTVGSGVSAGGIEFDSSGYTLGGAPITLTSNNNSGWLDGEVRLNGTADTISAALAGSVGLTKTGTGTLNVTGASTYSGATAIQNGTIAIATANDRLPTGTGVTLGGGDTSGVLQLGDGTTAYDQTVAKLENVDGGGRVVGGGTNVATLTLALNDGVSDGFNGSLGGTETNQNNLKLAVTTIGTLHDGSLTLGARGSSTYSGGTTLESGTLSASNSSRLGSGPLEFAGGTCYLQGTVANDIIADALTTSYLLLPVATLTFNGDISGAGTIHCTNSGHASAVLNLHGDNHNFTGTFDQWNSFGGTMTTYFTSDTAGSASATWEIESGTLAGNSDNWLDIQLGALSGGGTLRNANGADTVNFYIGGKGVPTQFDGVIENGNGGVVMTKVGTATLTLTGENTYDGSTNVRGGTLILARSENCLSDATCVLLGDPVYGGSGVLQLGDGTTSCTQSIAALYTNGGTEDRVVGGTAGDNRLIITFSDYGQVDEYDGMLGGPDTNQNNLSLEMDGDSAVVLMGDDSYTGGTNINAGMLGAMPWDTAMGTGTIFLNGGTLAGAYATLDNPIEVDSESGICTLDNFTLNGNITSDESNPVTLNCTNILYGDAYLDASLYLGGDNGSFFGTFFQQVSHNNSHTSCMSTYFTNAAAGSAHADWNIDEGLLAGDLSQTGTVALGGLAGWGTLGNVAPGTNVTYEVGGNGESTEFHGVIADGAPLAASETTEIAPVRSQTHTFSAAAGITPIFPAGSLPGLDRWLAAQGGAPTTVTNGSRGSNESDALTESDPGTVALTTTGTLTLTGQNTYSGDTTVEGGTLQVGDGGTSGTLGSGNVIDNATLVFNHSDDITVSNAISGTGNVVQQGTGTLYLTGDNTFGGLVVDGGTFPVTSSTFLGASNGGVTVSGSGVLDLEGFNVVLGTVTLADGTIKSSLGNPTLTASSYTVMKGTISVSLKGTGTLSKCTSDVVYITGDNSSYTGTTTVLAGTLDLGVNAQHSVLDLPVGANIQGGMLVLDYAGGTDPASQVQTLLDTSYLNYTTYPFDSGQLRTSAASVAVGLGWADSPTIGGHAYSNQVVILPTLYGDATLDGVVGPADLSKLLTAYGMSGTTWRQGDFTYDGIVGPADLSKLLTNYGVQTQSGPPTVDLFSCLGANPTTDSTLKFVIAFSEGVSGVDISSFSDFQLLRSGTTGTITSVQGYGPAGNQATYVVTVSGVTGTGTLELDLLNHGTIHDTPGRLLAGPPTIVGPTYRVIDAGAASGKLNVVDDTNKQDLVCALMGATDATGQGSGMLVTRCDLSCQVDGVYGPGESTGVFVNNLDPGGTDAYRNMAPYGIVLSTGNANQYGSGPNLSPDDHPLYRTIYSPWGESYDYGGYYKARPVTDPAERALLKFITPIPSDQNFFDATRLDLTVNVLPGYDTITFQVVFGSEEFSYWLSYYPDAFGAYVNGINVAQVDAIGPPWDHPTRSRPVGHPIIGSGVDPGDALGLWNINADHPQMAYLAGTELNGVLAPGGNVVMTFTAPAVLGANTITFIIGDSLDSSIDSTAYIANLHATWTGSGGAGAGALAAEPAAENLAAEALVGESAEVASFAANATAGSLWQSRRVLCDSSGSVASQIDSVVVGSPLDPVAGQGNGENADTVGIQLSAIAAAISTSDASTSETGLTTDTVGSPDRGLNAAAVDSLLCNGLDSLDAARTFATVATIQIRGDLQA